MGNLLSVDEVARRLQVSTHTVKQWIRERRLPVIRPSRRVVRIPEEALETFLSKETDRQHDGLVVVSISQLTRIVDTAVRRAVKEALESASSGDGGGKLLTVAEVARRFGVGKDVVYRWVKEGRLPSVRPSPRVIRIPEAALKGAPNDGQGTAEVGADEQH